MPPAARRVLRPRPIVLALIVALAASLIAAGAHATQLAHCDLVSTAAGAADVVRAERIGERLAQGARLGRYRVTRVYAGTLAVDATFEVDDSEYGSPSSLPLPTDRFVFLAPAQRGAATRQLAPGGLRVVRGDRVERFYQVLDAQPSYPTPQHDALDDGRNYDTRSRPAVSTARFEAMITEAVDRARAGRDLVARWPADAAPRLLARLLPAGSDAADDDDEPRHPRYRDPFSAMVITALIAHRAWDAALEAIARRGLDAHVRATLLPSLPVPELVARACVHADRSVRVAAVRLLDHAAAEDDGAADAVTALLGDPEARVREAAATALATLGTGVPVGAQAAAFTARRLRARRALAARFATERDAAVRFAIASAIGAFPGGLSALGQQRARVPLAFRTRVEWDGSVTVRAACTSARASADSDVRVVAVDPQGQRTELHHTYTVMCQNTGGGSSMGSSHRVSLAPGRHHLWLEPRRGPRALLGTLVVPQDGAWTLEP